MKQVDKMRHLKAIYGADEDRIIAEYAAAELAGEVKRESNTYEMSANEYAKRLYYNTFKRKR